MDISPIDKILSILLEPYQPNLTNQSHKAEGWAFSLHQEPML